MSCYVVLCYALLCLAMLCLVKGFLSQGQSKGKGQGMARAWRRARVGEESREEGPYIDLYRYLSIPPAMGSYIDLYRYLSPPSHR